MGVHGNDCGVVAPNRAISVRSGSSGVGGLPDA
jgi:hypothetical protein